MTRCQVCDDKDPRWTVMRQDAVVTWACGSHLDPVLSSLQRDYEVTSLAVTDARKAREWGGIARVLNDVAEGRA